MSELEEETSSEALLVEEEAAAAQITMRGVAASVVLGTLFCVITHKLNLTVGVLPSLNVAAGLMGFFFLKSWTGFLSRLGFVVSPFTKQENTVVQTCVVACYGLAFSGGFGSYLLAMDERSYQLVGPEYPGNRAEDVKNPGLGWIIGFLFVVSFLGLFCILPLRKAQSSPGASSGPSFPDKPGTGIQLIWTAMISRVCLDTRDMCNRRISKHKELTTPSEFQDDGTSDVLIEQAKMDLAFLKDNISTWLAAAGYLSLAAISTVVVPLIFPALKWYLVLASYIFAPVLAFCNAYGTGLTDCSLVTTYGKIGLFMIASLVGTDGGVVAGLAASGLMMTIVSTAADLMQDFKTGYLTLTSSKAMFLSQALGTVLGCIIAPLTFWLYWTAFDIGAPDGPYKAPYAVIFRQMAILGVQGFSVLPRHCLGMCYGSFAAALIINLLRDITPKKVSRLIPIPMAMAVPFYIGAYFAIDMFVGSVILYVWERVNRKDANDYSAAVASGLICGDGIWTIPSAILSVMRVNPPICMSFVPSIR